MVIVQETTDWGKHNVMNHVYVLNNSMTHMVAYVPAGSRTVKKFSKPMSFDRRGRTFVELEGGKASEPQVRIVEGSGGKKYRLTEQDGSWRCSCPGYLFRGKCRHVEDLTDK